MNEQLSFDSAGRIRGKVELAIDRLRTFEPPEGYYLAFSGGKDSQCIYHLAKMAGVKFHAVYRVTSVDPPELVQFIKEHYPDVKREIPHDKDGKPVTMWSLIKGDTMPPTRIQRYCCARLKETGGGIGDVVVTGVRWAESARRKKSHGSVNIQGKKKDIVKAAKDSGAIYDTAIHGRIVLNDDNDASRRMVEQCYRTMRTLVNPIVDWTDDDVWNFIGMNKLPYCRLYDEGFKRLGCIGCPMGMKEQMLKQFERWPKYKEAYLRAFQRMCDAHPGAVNLVNKPTDDIKALFEREEQRIGRKLTDGEKVMVWWIEKS